jgi:hypothetical protein
VAAAYDHAGLLSVAGALCALAALVHGGIALDEAAASFTASRLAPRARQASRTWLGAWSAYAMPVAGYVAILLGWSAVEVLALDGVAIQYVHYTASPGEMLVLVLIPIAALHVGLVTLQIARPDAVGTPFRLGHLLERDARWEGLLGLASLALVVLLADHGVGDLFVASVALASVTAAGPVSALLRALSLAPFVIWFRDDGGAPAMHAEAPAAVMALYSRPPVALRAGRLVQLAYLPMMLVLIGQFAG